MSFLVTRMSSEEDKSAEQPQPPPAPPEEPGAPAPSPAAADKRPRGRPRKDGASPFPRARTTWCATALSRDVGRGLSFLCSRGLPVASVKVCISRPSFPLTFGKGEDIVLLCLLTFASVVPAGVNFQSPRD